MVTETDNKKYYLLTRRDWSIVKLEIVDSEGASFIDWESGKSSQTNKIRQDNSLDRYPPFLKSIYDTRIDTDIDPQVIVSDIEKRKITLSELKQKNKQSYKHNINILSNHY